jgi:17beta-estradiol 17-dehydrogenase / very-long-chain 3-oxoacyl-CoA reductase
MQTDNGRWFACTSLILNVFGVRYIIRVVVVAISNKLFAVRNPSLSEESRSYKMEYFNKLSLLRQSVMIPVAMISLICLWLYLFVDGSLVEKVGISFSLLATVFLVNESLYTIYSTWIGPALGHHVDLRKMGKWALVTGATDGIGKAYAEALAKLGINIVLVSRSEKKLEQVSTELSTKYNILTEIIAADFRKGREMYAGIKNRLRELDLEIGVLINNVGMSYMSPELFLDIPDGEQFFEDILNCNIMSMLMMTKIILPGMVERRKGVVVNVGSLSCRILTPYMTIYGASKAFMDHMTTLMGHEYREYGIVFQYIFPSYITTNMSRIKISSWTVPTPQQFVAVAIKSIGLQNSSAIWISHRINHFFVKWGMTFRPRFGDETSYSIWRSVWLHSKKKMMIRQRQSVGEEMK